MSRDPGAGSVSRAEVQAALDRALALMLVQAAFNNDKLFQRSRIEARALSDVLDGAWAMSATRPYQPAPMLQAAWAALPENLEFMSMAQVQEFLSAHGVEITTDDVTELEVDAGQQLEDGQGFVVVPHEEQTAGRVHGHHGAGDAVLSHGGAL